MVPHTLLAHPRQRIWVEELPALGPMKEKVNPPALPRPRAPRVPDIPKKVTRSSCSSPVEGGDECNGEHEPHGTNRNPQARRQRTHEHMHQTENGMHMRSATTQGGCVGISDTSQREKETQCVGNSRAHGVKKKGAKKWFDCERDLQASGRTRPKKKLKKPIWGRHITTHSHQQPG